MMQDISQEQLIQIKYAFEKEIVKHNIKVLVYYTNNSYFAEKGFRNEISDYNEIIIYYGVSTHH